MGTGVFIYQKGQKSTKVPYDLCTELSLCVPQMKEVIEDGNVGLRKDDSSSHLKPKNLKLKFDRIKWECENVCVHLKYKLY